MLSQEQNLIIIVKFHLCSDQRVNISDSIDLSLFAVVTLALIIFIHHYFFTPARSSLVNELRLTQHGPYVHGTNIFKQARGEPSALVFRCKNPYTYND